MNKALGYAAGEFGEARNPLTRPDPSIVLPPGVLDGVFRIDSSGFGRIQECHRFAWYLLAHRREADYRDDAMGFGQAIHAALDVKQKFGSGPYSTEQRQAMERAIEREFQGVQLDEEEYRTEGRAKEVLGLYLETYPEEPFEIVASELAGEKELGSVEFTLSLANGRTERRSCTVVWQGKTDGIWRDRGTGALAVKDTKTTREARLEAKHAELKMSHQLPMYCWLFSKPGEPINEAIVDLVIVRKPVAKVTAKTAPRTEFHRLPLTFSDDWIQERQWMALTTISQWLSACGAGAPPMTGAPRQCVWPKTCPYLNVCELATERERLAWLGSGEYRDYGWDPMRVSGEEG